MVRPVPDPLPELDPESLYVTSVPGLAIEQYRRRTLTLNDGRKVRSRTYCIIHEPSGAALLPGANGTAKHAPTLAMALDVVTKLAAVPGARGRVVDWTRPLEELQEVQRIKDACMALAGWVAFGGRKDRLLNEWAAEHGVRLSVTDA